MEVIKHAPVHPFSAMIVMLSTHAASCTWPGLPKTMVGKGLVVTTHLPEKGRKHPTKLDSSAEIVATFPQEDTL